jgi:acyl-CoA thioesterase FadM
MSNRGQIDDATGEYRVERTVYLGDDDSSSLIYFVSYFRYMAEGDQDMFDALGQPVMRHIPTGFSCPSVSSNCDFISPARAGDTIVQTVRITCGARTSFTCEHEFTVAGVTVARGRVARVWVNLSTMTPEPLPEWVRSAAYRHPTATTT